MLDADAGAWLADRVGDADGIVLLSHGVIVIGTSIEEATYRAATFERMCRLTADALIAGTADPRDRTRAPRGAPGRVPHPRPRRVLERRGPHARPRTARRPGLTPAPDAMPVTIDELSNMAEFGGGGERLGAVTFLPEPEPREVFCPVISTDDHIVEPPHMWEGRFPAKHADAAPRVVETEDGGQRWLWGGELIANVGFNAVAGRPSTEYGFEPTRFDEMRKGAWDIDARLADMDINGVWASVCFPSFLPGFVGQRISLAPADPDLGMAAMRAWNDWMLEEWCGRDPDRMIPMQLPWLRDPEVAAAEIRRNAERGFKAVTFSESPDKLGLPSIHTGYWDPFLAACEETETVVCLHVGSSSTSPSTTDDAPPR